MPSKKTTSKTKNKSGKIEEHGANDVLLAAPKAPPPKSSLKSRGARSSEPESGLRKPITAALAIEQVPIEQLRPNPNNPRQNDAAVEAVARSIQAYGFNNPIITDGDLNIAAGHTRLKAAGLLGLQIVPVIRIEGLVGSKFTGFSIADNKTAEIAEWDLERLNKLVAELNQDIDFDITSLGFDDRELTEILDWDYCDDDDRADEAPPLPQKPITRPGDLWILGDHRLLCGDAKSVEHLQRLVNGQHVDCLITDPPYGVNYHSRGRKKTEWGKHPKRQHRYDGAGGPAPNSLSKCRRSLSQRRHHLCLPRYQRRRNTSSI